MMLGTYKSLLAAKEQVAHLAGLVNADAAAKGPVSMPGPDRQIFQKSIAK